MQEFVTIGQLDGFDLHLVIVLADLPGMDELVVSQSLADGAFEQVASKQLFRSRVGKLDMPTWVCNDDAISQLVEHGGETGAVSVGSSKLEIKCGQQVLDCVGEFF